MTLRSLIWSSDLMLCFERLRPSTAYAAERIAQALGFDAVTSRASVASQQNALSMQVKSPTVRLGAHDHSRERPIDVQRLPNLQPISTELEPRPRMAPTTGRGSMISVQDWSGKCSLREPPSAQMQRKRLPHVPLFNPRRQHDILLSCASIETLDGPVDIDALVEAIARRGIVHRLPNKPSLSLRRGLQILVDVGEGMELFHRDQKALISSLRSILGRDGVSEVRFRADPLERCQLNPAGDWVRYEPPREGTPVLVLTDLGISVGRRRESTDPSRWLKLATLLNSRASRLTIFTPYPHHRWPSTLRGRITIVHWDCATTYRALNLHRVQGALWS